MDSFIRIFAIYRQTSRRWAAAYVYRRASVRWKIILWSTKIAFAAFAILQFMLTPDWPYLLALWLSACLWAFCFDRSRRAAFSSEYRLYPERIKYFARDYQYLRYLEFKRRLYQGPYAVDVDEALRFLEDQLSTDSQGSIASHPVMTVLVGTLLAVLGAAAGQWPAKDLIYTLAGTVMALYFSAMVLGMLQTKHSDLRELKRFLLWAKHEQAEP